MFLAHIRDAFRRWRRYRASLRKLNRLPDNDISSIDLKRADVPQNAADVPPEAKAHSKR